VTRPPLAAFDDASFDAVVRESAASPASAESSASAESAVSSESISGSRLRRLVADHQQSVRDLPGVENIVYEWRRSFPVNPVVLRTDSAYVLVVEPWVWDEFAAALSLSDAETDAVRAVHDHQFRRSVTAERDRLALDDTDADSTDADSTAGEIDDTPPAGRLETDADGTLQLGDWAALVLTRP
jgi:hypothetical protein